MIRTGRQKLKDQVYLTIAHSIALLGTCCRLKVGCIMLTANGRVACMGFNGAGPGMPHCHPDTCGPDKRCLRCSHSETNALAHRSGEPVTAYITHAPCLNCLREMALAGVRRIVYARPYTSMPPEEAAAQKEWINHYGISLEEHEPPT